MSFAGPDVNKDGGARCNQLQVKTPISPWNGAQLHRQGSGAPLPPEADNWTSRTAHCVLDLGKNTLAFPGGPTVEIVHPTQALRPLPPTWRAAEAHHGLQASPPTTLSPASHTPFDALPPALDQQPTAVGVDRLAAE